MHSSVTAAAESAPAAGAELGQVIGATSVALLLTAALFTLGMRHRSGRAGLLGRVADRAGALAGLPGWAALPMAIAGVSLLTAALGLYWDVSLHIDDGRDAGPLANPSHYFILAGLFGIFTAGFLAIVLPGDERPGPAAVELVRGWHAPVSGLAMIGCASFALAGFPLDDVSHRLFGQDVTLWGPTHLMMLGGAAMTLIAILGLLVEGRAAAPHLRQPTPPVTAGGLLTASRLRTLRVVSACGGLLIALSIFQGEFDFGVPQFNLLFHPVLIALAAGVALVLARTLLGRGGALGAAAFFIAVRGGLTLLVAEGFGEAVAHFPLFVAEALLVEAVALRADPRRMPYRFAIAAGAAIGTVGVLAEWGWSHVWMPHAWPARLLPEAIGLALPVAFAGAVLGAFVAGALRRRREVSGTRPRIAAAVASLLTIAAVLGFLLPTSAPDTRAAVELREVAGAEPSEPDPAAGTDAAGAAERTVIATVRLDPADAGEGDVNWLSTIAWQGGEPLRVEPLERIREGVYRSAPVPVGGSWKTMVRLHRGRELAGVPIYLPADPAIPVAGVAAAPRFERAFVRDHELLQRERLDDVPGWLWGAAGLVVLALTAALLALIGWALVRLARSRDRDPVEEPPAHPPEAAPAPSGRRVATPASA